METIRGYKKLILFPVFFLLCSSLFSSPLYSPTWGFSLDLPEGYEYTEGDKKDRFSFETADGAMFDLVVYYAAPNRASPYSSVEALAEDVVRRLKNFGDTDSFEYRQKKAVIIELSFSSPGGGGRSYPMTGWALCMELGDKSSAPRPGGAAVSRVTARPLLLAMAYGPAEKQELMPLHFSALDSIAPEEADKLAPGPITEYSYPRENLVSAPIFGLDIEAEFYEEDDDAAQALVDREFQVLRRHEFASDWKEAWIRFYRAIYRDSYERLSDAAFKIERRLSLPSPLTGDWKKGPKESRDFADAALQWVQSFTYERDTEGSDFVNLVSAVIEGRGDCDPRAMLWAIILKQADIPSAIMVSRQFSHAMGLADLPGVGAHFKLDGREYLVAETTAKVSIGLIEESMSEISAWLGISFE